MSHDGRTPLSDSFYLTQLPNGYVVGRFPALDALADFTHAVTTKQGPDATRIRNDLAYSGRCISEALGLRETAFLEQVHGPDVIVPAAGGHHGKGDGLAGHTPGLGLSGRSADCPLILAADPATGACGVAHASWRGTVQKIAKELIAVLTGKFGSTAANIVACICPSAGPCCYEVGPEVVKSAIGKIGPHAERFFVRREGRTYFDLWSANVDQLALAGLHRENVHVAGVCTMCRNDLFPSHRREGDAAGRFVAAIARR